MKATDWIDKLPPQMVESGVKAGVIDPNLYRAYQIQKLIASKQKDQRVSKSEAVVQTSIEENITERTIWRYLKK